ncbi:hypothetical protein HDU76_007128 [Blyttiomyces sp. JEL0837]|nr:hypothetical protein HDU76_007128 [Blyttiomyces sp. JEL0837]
MHAIVFQGNATADIQSVDKPKPGPNEILFYPDPVGAIIGCDFAGVVVEIGSNVSQADVSRLLNNRVTGFVHGSKHSDRGAFSEYLVTDPQLVTVIPTNISFEDAATVPLAYLTAVQGLFQRLALPEPSSPAKTPLGVLVWAGSTSVGLYAIQLAKLAGLSVFTTCSPKNYDLVKSLGATHVFDYKDPDVASKIVAAAADAKVSLAHGFDCVSTGDSTVLVSKCLQKGGKICTLLTTTGPYENDVTVAVTLIYTVFGTAFEFIGNSFPASKEDHAFASTYSERLTGYLAEGKILPNKKRVMEGGLKGLLEGMKVLESGSYSAEKLVAKIQEA